MSSIIMHVTWGSSVVQEATKLQQEPPEGWGLPLKSRFAWVPSFASPDLPYHLHVPLPIVLPESYSLTF